MYPVCDECSIELAMTVHADGDVIYFCDNIRCDMYEGEEEKLHFLHGEKDIRVTKILHAIVAEYELARTRHKPLNSFHEAYAVTLEELEEFWDEVKADNDARAFKEILQVAAMAFATMLEL